LVTQQTFPVADAATESQDASTPSAGSNATSGNEEQVVIDVGEEAVLRRLGGTGYANFKVLAETLGI
jgi:hypothetical protein